MIPLKYKPPSPLVMDVLAALARHQPGDDDWTTPGTIAGELGRSSASVARSSASAVSHAWVDRRYIYGQPYYHLTGAGRAELKLAGR